MLILLSIFMNGCLSHLHRCHIILVVLVAVKLQQWSTAVATFGLHGKRYEPIGRLKLKFWLARQRFARVAEHASQNKGSMFLRAQKGHTRLSAGVRGKRRFAGKAARKTVSKYNRTSAQKPR